MERRHDDGATIRCDRTKIDWIAKHLQLLVDRCDSKLAIRNIPMGSRLSRLRCVVRAGEHSRTVWHCYGRSCLRSIPSRAVKRSEAHLRARLAEQITVAR